VKGSSGLKLLAVTLRLLKERRQLLILPITLFIGAEQAFLFADYNAVSKPRTAYGRDSLADAKSARFARDAASARLSDTLSSFLFAFAVLRFLRVGDQQHRLRHDLLRRHERRGRARHGRRRQGDRKEARDALCLLPASQHPDLHAALETHAGAGPRVLPGVGPVGRVRLGLAGAGQRYVIGQSRGGGRDWRHG